MTAIEVIRLAYAKGYRVDDCGQVFSPKGKLRKLSKYVWAGKDKDYECYRFNIDPDFPPVPVHRLVAFQKFGEDAFKPGIQTRHLNNNSLDNAPDNVALGTPSQNAFDQEPLERRRHAAKCFQKYTAAFIAQLRAEYGQGNGYKVLRQKHGIPLATLSYYLSVEAKRKSFSHPI